MGRPSLSRVFGDVLKEHREAAGFSQEALADRAGVHRTYIGLVERGKRNPTLAVALRFAAALGTTLTTLVQVTEERLHRF